MATAKHSKWIDKHELKRLLALMLPLYVGNLLGMGMGVTDTLVAGWKGEEELAAVAMGFSIAGTITIGTGAILTILSAMISRLRGAGVENKIGLFLNNGKVLALCLSVFELLVIFCASFLFQWTTDNASLAHKAQLYTWFVMLGVPGNLLMRLVTANFEGYGQTRPAMLIALISLLLNIPLNYMLVFGVGPFPALGGAGCGLATAIIMWCSGLLLLGIMLYSRRHRQRALQLLAWRRAEWGLVRHILKLGLPVGVAALCEMSFFSLVTLVIAPLGEQAVSAQQVAINVSGVIFMLPMSLGIAASIRAAYHVGGQRQEAFRAMLRTLLCITYAMITVLMAGTILLRRQIVELYTDSVQMIELASGLLIYCAVYQIADATQAIMSGLLRGCHDTPIITWSNLVSYWVVGFPLACILIHTDWLSPAPLGPAGAWISFIVALTLTAAILTTRFAITRRKIFCK
ncbi:MAG: MATE family efflux transporter [Akkermansiaceae bacterium]|nr:MATE family efflux transporter [Akkermansiaceae bacterium]